VPHALPSTLARVHVHLVGPDGLTAAELTDATTVLAGLVAAGAALGWVDPPDFHEVSALLREVWTAAPGDSALAVATDEGGLHGLAYWRRYERATHRPHADVEKVAVAPAAQGRSIGRRLMVALIDAARTADVEVLTLDLRADNDRAAALYESLGFHRYGLLPRFVAVGTRRYDKLFYALDLRGSENPAPKNPAPKNPAPPREPTRPNNPASPKGPTTPKEQARPPEPVNPGEPAKPKSSRRT
jgi:ribosomal protein S18 acetylase RimI-like enzyme